MKRKAGSNGTCNCTWWTYPKELPKEGGPCWRRHTRVLGRSGSPSRPGWPPRGGRRRASRQCRRLRCRAHPPRLQLPLPAPPAHLPPLPSCAPPHPPSAACAVSKDDDVCIPLPKVRCHHICGQFAGYCRTLHCGLFKERALHTAQDRPYRAPTRRHRPPHPPRRIAPYT